MVYTVLLRFLSLRLLSSRLVRIALTFTLFVVLSSGCASSRKPVPTGVVPQAKPLTVTEEQYGHQVLSALTERWELDYNHPRYANVTKVVERLTSAAKADKDPWHVYVLKDDKTKNAAATRGNHIFVWTGLLDATQNDEELATILSHEISHVLARHTDPDPNEQIKQLLIQVGAVAAGVAAASATNNAYAAKAISNIASSAAKQVGSGILIYPYSREMEFEADRIGLFMMADARFDPKGAIRFWTRAKNDPDFGNSLVFLSSHPAAADRLEQLNRLLGQAETRYQMALNGQTPSSNDRSVPILSPSSPLATGSNQRKQPQDREQIMDSFDVSKATPSAVVLSGAPQATPSSSWRITSSKAVLLSSADPKSRPIGEFRGGAIVEAVSETVDWIEIDRPDHGFLLKKQLERRP